MDKEISVSDTVIEIRDLVKTYGKMNAVDGISLSIMRGEVFAFLGPNGAGKTTTVEIIEGIRTPTKGEVRLLGFDSRKGSEKMKVRIGVLPQEFTSFDKLTVKETVDFFRSLYKNPIENEDLLKMLKLGEHRKKLYQELSGGLKQRVGIAASLVNDPEIVFLDEPTTGLDPQARQEVWAVIRKLKAQGKTIFLTTHYMEEAQELADHVAIISHGRIIAEGTVEELIERHGKGTTLEFIGPDPEMMKLVQGLGVKVSRCSSEKICVILDNKSDLLNILELVRGANMDYRGINVRRSNLEEVFLLLTGEELIKEGEK
ncbi:MAG: ABC transporter ATP-binding protein [Thermoplasmatota archaeon]